MNKVVVDPDVRWISEHWQALSSCEPGVPSFAFLSIPFDYAVSHRPGTRFGPRNIIDALNGFSLYCTDKRVCLDEIVLTNLGDVDIVHSLETSYANIQQATAKIPSGFIPIFLGGDHSIADPIVRGLKSRAPGEKFGIIVFDAHFDSRPPIPGKEHSGHWMKTLEDLIDYQSVVQLGINACIYSRQYMETAERNGVMVRTPYDIRKQGWSSIISEAIEHASAGMDGIYISVDIDSIDQAFAPGTSVPNICGLFPYEVADAIFEICSKSNVIGIDINEVSPPLDNQNFTSQVAATICMNFMAGIVERGRHTLAKQPKSK
jgi:agmatinase